ncbi:MAG: MaoC family dehydratase [Gammaproteobacteria bacterium]
MGGIYYDELQPGERIEHALRRTVTETDNVLITTLTHNPAALHLDAETMGASEFGRVLVNSCFTLSLMIGVSVGDTTHGTAVANLGFDEVRFPNPVFVGDTLRFETEVATKRESRSRPNAGIVTFEHRAFNQDDELVATCTRVGLIAKRPAA